MSVRRDLGDPDNIPGERRGLARESMANPKCVEAIAPFWSGGKD